LLALGARPTPCRGPAGIMPGGAAFDFV
jgi:hypothetical protein